MRQITQKFNLSGVITAINSNDQHWLEELKKSISSPAVHNSSKAELEIDLIEIENEAIEKVLPLPGDEYKFEEASVMLDQLVTITSYQREEETWQEIKGYARIHNDYKQRRGVIYRLKERRIVNPFFADSFFAVNLIQKMMSCFKFHTIHASCAEINGQGVIITGPGGRGKSTSAYALARRGHPLLNDEKILLKLNSSYQASSVSDIFKIRKNAIDRFFPELLSAKPIYRPDEDEFCFKAGIMPGMQITVASSADILIILHQVNQPESTAKMINPARVVGELFPVTMNPRNKKSTADKFEFLTDFLQQVTCYQIDFGFDMDKFAELIEDLTRQQIDRNYNNRRILNNNAGQ
ncbi:MAG: hypothetical protein PHU36_07020 [Syntrophomonadaceae bacterium]|nr:hypothetical protein [Syntrophomonadaceae bacterium]